MQQRLPVAAGTATLTVFLAAAILLPKTTSQVLRDSAFDIELAGDHWLRRPAPSDLKVIVVDIDRASIDALGTWPWPRETMARPSGRHRGESAEGLGHVLGLGVGVDVVREPARGVPHERLGGPLRSRSMCCSLSPTIARQRRSHASLDR